MAKRRRWLWPTLCGLAVALPVGAEWQHSKLRVPVEVGFVRPDTVRLTLTATGALMPALSVDVGSRVTGTLVELRVAEGDTVARGEILGRVAPDVGVSMRELAQAAELDAAARLAAAEEGLREASRRLSRLRELATRAEGHSLVAPQELESAQAEVRIAEAAVNAANAQRITAMAAAKDADNAEGRVVMTAPFAGVVTRVHRRPGEIVVPATYGGESGRVLTLAMPGRARVVVPVPERYALELDSADAAEGRVLVEPAIRLPMMVRAVRTRNQSPPGGGGFEVELEVDTRGSTLPWGTTTLVRITVLSQPAPRVIPLSALVPDPQDPSEVGVFVLDDDHARYRRVEVSRYGDDSAALESGPPAGTPVISLPFDSAPIRDGTAVRRIE